MTRTGIIAQNVPLLMSLIRWLHVYRHPSLRQTLLDIDYENPVGLSAGFDKEARLPKLMQAIGFGFIEVGSITAERYDGNQKPWYRRLPHTKSVLVYSGLRSSGVTPIANGADRKLKKISQNFIINASVAKTNIPSYNTVDKSIRDYCNSLKRLEKSPWPKVYTINISCPNTVGGEPFNKPENLKKLLNAIDDLKLSRPVFLKLPIDLPWSRTSKLVNVAAESTVSGLTVGNLSKDRTLVDPRDKLTDDKKGNLSGKPCWEASNELLARSYTAYGDRFVYSGVGGIFNAEDAYTKIKLGASLLEMITGMIYGGPGVIAEINKGIAERLAKDGYSNISAAVGVDAERFCKEELR